jgi:hypothetical protein
LKLKLVELIYNLIKLNKEPILEKIGESNFFAKLSVLLEKYPWNNFLQLKSIALYEELLEGQVNERFRKVALDSSKIAQTLTNLAAKNKFNHTSGAPIRHGYMACVIKIATILEKNKQKSEVEQYLLDSGEEWKNFIDNEYKISTERNTKSLGGQQPRSNSGDDDDSDVNFSMESIM